MKFALVISILLVGMGAVALSVTAAAGDVTSRDGGAAVDAQAVPCPTNTPQVVRVATPPAEPIAAAAPARVRMPETGSAGLLPGSRRPLAMQSTPACPQPTQPNAAPAQPSATPTATATVKPMTSVTPDASIPSLGAPMLGGGTFPGGPGY
jgi:hypothetical protein